MRVYELAKALGMSSKELIAKLTQIGVEAKGHLTNLEPQVVEKAKNLWSVAAKKEARKEESPSSKQAIKEPVRHPVKHPTKETVKEPAREVKEPLKEPAREVRESLKERVKEIEKPVKGPIQEIKEPVKGPVKAVAKVSVKEPVREAAVKPAVKPTVLQVDFPVSVKDLAVKLGEKPSALMKKMIVELDMFASINQMLVEESALKVASLYGVILERMPTQEEKVLKVHQKTDKTKLKLRPPVITLMGHVDHGKTSLLDAIRNSQLADKEHGGITQHIGAYEVRLPQGKITFLDTPGHEAFTAMRSRGATITDIVILVVAADDGVMPQTVEAIDHAKVADVPIVVAINKIDRPGANPDRVKKQLMELGLSPEEWGGKTITVEVSAKTGKGIDSLLEMLLLQAEILELKADYEKPASGVIIEAKLSGDRGPVTTVLVKDGCLRLGDILISGLYYGKVRAMFDDLARRVEEVTPGSPVEILGLDGTPQAGEPFYVLNDEKTTRDIVMARRSEQKREDTQERPKVTLEALSKEIQEGKAKELRIVLKADVQGSLEALENSLLKLPQQEVQLRIIHKGLSAINASDVLLASASDAVIIGFHVELDSQAKEASEREHVDVRSYRVIYEAIEEIKAALEGMLEPKIKRVSIGKVQVRKVFQLSRSGTVAGCLVAQGRIHRNAQITLYRDDQKIYEGPVASLKRFKDDVREVQEGFECGVVLKDFSAIQEGDVLDVFEVEKIARRL